MELLNLPTEAQMRKYPITAMENVQWLRVHPYFVGTSANVQYPKAWEVYFSGSDWKSEKKNDALFTLVHWSSCFITWRVATQQVTIQLSTGGSTKYNEECFSRSPKGDPKHGRRPNFWRGQGRVHDSNKPTQKCNTHSRFGHP